jgi:hypothetical protein
MHKPDLQNPKEVLLLEINKDPLRAPLVHHHKIQQTLLLPKLLKVNAIRQFNQKLGSSLTS